MSGALGQIIGGMIPIFILSLLFRRWLAKNPTTIGKALLPVGLAYVLTAMIAAFGMADGGEPKFGNAAFVYGISALAVALLVAVGFSRKLREADIHG